MYKPKLFCLALLCLSFAHAQQWHFVLARGHEPKKPMRSIVSFSANLYTTVDVDPSNDCTIWSPTNPANTCNMLENTTPNYSLFVFNNVLYTGRYKGVGVFQMGPSPTFGWSNTSLKLPPNTVCKTFTTLGGKLLVGTSGTHSGIWAMVAPQSWSNIISHGLIGNQANVNVLESLNQDLYAGTDGGVLVRHQNTWKIIDSGNVIKGKRILALKVTPRDLFIGTATDGIYHATAVSNGPNGIIWSPFILFNDFIFPLRSQGGLLPGNKQANVLYMRGDSLFAGVTHGNNPLYVSTRRQNQWTGWKAHSNGLTNIKSVFSMALHGSSMYAGTDLGLYKYGQ